MSHGRPCCRRLAWGLLATALGCCSADARERATAVVWEFDAAESTIVLDWMVPQGTTSAFDTRGTPR